MHLRGGCENDSAKLDALSKEHIHAAAIVALNLVMVDLLQSI